MSAGLGKGGHRKFNLEGLNVKEILWEWKNIKEKNTLIIRICRGIFENSPLGWGFQLPDPCTWVRHLYWGIPDIGFSLYLIIIPNALIVES